MNFRRLKALIFLILFGLLLYSACQVNKAKPTVSVQPTATGVTPTVEKIEEISVLSPSAANTVEPTPSLVPTPVPHLSLQPFQLNGLQIHFWHPWSGQTANRAAALVDNFNRTNQWGIIVKVTPFYSAGSLFEAVEGMKKQDPANLPRVMAAPEEQLHEWKAREAEFLLPLDEYIALPDLGLTQADIEMFYPEYWQISQVDNLQLGIPSIRSANVIFYNQTWAKEMGFFNPPKTPDEFKQQACAAAVKNNTSMVLEKYGTGGWLVDLDSLTILSWLEAFGSHPLPEQARAGYSFESDESQNALAFLRGMLDGGCAWIGRSQTPDDFFSNRLALFYTGTLQDVLVQKQLSDLAKSEDKWILLSYPREDGSGITFSNGYALSVLNIPEIPAGEESYNQQMAAWLFIRWMSRPENLAQLGQEFPSLPVSKSVAAILEQDKTQFPWDLMLPLMKNVQPAPSFASWRTVRRLVEDAGWQIYHLPLDQVNQILPQLDQSVKEILK